MDEMANMLWTGILGERFVLRKRYPEQIQALLNDSGFDAVTCYPTEKKGMKKGTGLVIRSTVKTKEISESQMIPQEMYVTKSH